MRRAVCTSDHEQNPVAVEAKALTTIFYQLSWSEAPRWALEWSTLNKF
jgi:hypothetical protein